MSAASSSDGVPGSPDQRFPLRHRLRQSSDFAAVRKQGRSRAGRYVVLAVRNVSDDTPFKIGFITSRKIGNAVVRNRVRRKLREVFRKHREDFRSGWHASVIARWRSPAASVEELETDLLRLARHLGVHQSRAAR